MLVFYLAASKPLLADTPHHIPLCIIFRNLDTCTCIHGLDKEGIEVGEDVPVDEKNAVVEPDGEESEDVAPKQGDDQIYR